MPYSDPSPDSAAPVDNSQSSQGGAMPPSSSESQNDSDAQNAGPQQVIEQFMGIRDILAQSLQGIGSQKNFPPEGTKALTTALQAYTQFLQVFGKFLGVDTSKLSAGGDGDEGTMGSQGEMNQGSTNAVPADMPMGRNIRAVPA